MEEFEECKKNDFLGVEKKQLGNDKEVIIREVKMSPKGEQKIDSMHSVEVLQHQAGNIVTYGSQIQNNQQQMLDKAQKQIREQIEQIKQLEVKDLQHCLKLELQYREGHIDLESLQQMDVGFGELDDQEYSFEEIQKCYDLYLVEKKNLEASKIEREKITASLKESNTMLQQLTAQKEEQVRSLLELISDGKKSSPCIITPDYQDGDMLTDSSPVRLILQQPKEIIRLKQENQNIECKMAEMKQNIQSPHDQASIISTEKEA